jgi:hypothetical protein
MALNHLQKRYNMFSDKDIQLDMAIMYYTRSDIQKAYEILQV